MQPNRRADDARANDIAFDDMQDDEDHQHDQRCANALCQRDEHTGRARYEHPQKRNEFQHEGEQAEQNGVGNLQDIHACANEYADQGRQSELAANVAADDAVNGIEDEDGAWADIDGQARTQPEAHTWPIGDEIDADDERDDHIRRCHQQRP